jgi:uncharacterized protein (DUF1684 family)
MNDLKQFRREKDELFRHDHHSPLSDEQKRKFNGLDYFPENPDLEFELEIEHFLEPDQVQIQTNTGEVQIYDRFGRINFEVEGEVAELTIFANDHGYFLPFADSLAGQETYGAGRYLEPIQIPGGKVLVDFNLAYNPYCAYNDRWSCPLTPPENRLKLPIRAGEKVFHSN